MAPTRPLAGRILRIETAIALVTGRSTSTISQKGPSSRFSGLSPRGQPWRIEFGLFDVNRLFFKVAGHFEQCVPPIVRVRPRRELATFLSTHAKTL
jgi:hypothetical protein